MPNLLFVSISFPPKNDPECIQAARYFKYVVSEGTFDVDVVTSEIPTLFMPEDKSLNHYSKGYRQMIKIYLWESKWLSFGLRKIGLDKILFPDSKMTFYWQWKNVVKQLTQRPDIIYSRSNPMSSAFMASRLKKFYRIPWVMHMSDPWILSPLKMRSTREQQKAEFELLKDADLIVFTTDATKELYASHYPSLKNRLSVLPNVFDPDDQFIRSPFVNLKWRVVYTGGLTGERSLSFFKNVLTMIKNDWPELLDELEILVAGPMDRISRTFFEENSFSCLKHLGELSYEKATTLQRQADLLLVVDNSTSGKDAVFFPSKLLDYFLTGLPILAITPEGSTTRKILSEYSSYCFAHNEIDKLSLFLMNEIKNRGAKSLNTQLAPPEKFNAKLNASLLIELLKKNLH